MPKPQHEFNFPRKTRVGAITLSCLLLLLVLFWKLLPSIIKPKIDPEDVALQQAWTKYKQENIKEVTPQKENYYSKYDKEDEGEGPSPVKTVTLFPFNPNTATEEALLRLDLPKYTVNTILKYRAKSSTAFKKKEDLQKLYTLSKADYERIAPYIQIPESDTARHFSSGNYAKTNQEPQNIELNAATAEQLMSLRGIGPGYSKRIINYREALGGFVSVGQLKEVYGFPDSTYQQLKDKFTINATLIKQINVNIADEQTLARQYYIGKKLAANIIRLRNDLKQFRDIEQIRQVPLINEEKYRKIAPYLTTH